MYPLDVLGWRGRRGPSGAGVVGDAPLRCGSRIGDHAGAGFIAEVVWGIGPVMVGEKE